MTTYKKLHYRIRVGRDILGKRVCHVCDADGVVVGFALPSLAAACDLIDFLEGTSA